MFNDVRAEALCGEASPFYLYDEGAPLRIEEKNPRAKIVIVLREPIERAYSHYLLEFRQGHLRMSFYDAILEDYDQPQKGVDVSFLLVELGLYYQQVKRYLDAFGPERVRVYLIDDLVADTAEVVKDICEFLGVPFYDGEFFHPASRYNVYAKPRNALFGRLLGALRIRSVAFSLLPKSLLALSASVLLAESSKPAVPPEAKKFLTAIYHDDIMRLQNLIGRDLNPWLVKWA